MKRIEVTVVRIYITEGGGLLRDLLRRLHDEEKVRGVTVFRGITGFGRSGRMHSASLVDLGMDLPVVVEFFDLPERVEQILHDLRDVIPAGHAVWWTARLNDGE
ncbi:DUF190 domain-containing protein [Inmirania thermothiophila]|uniref:Uncharacterized protein n=1 Tax=Inmirania thermothiophila TaxID=1750597 RepID=A0A3N1Y3K4_9GAMM|nr:DUF190 domain-containing protein [Inmirania thermothiophila]ROR32152.1 hypothetical protein EDC57_1343 [Inmirania thermothiophila]